MTTTRPLALLGTCDQFILGDYHRSHDDEKNARRRILKLPGGSLGENVGPKAEMEVKVAHYIAEMTKAFTWGGSLEISVVAKLFKVCIKVCIDDGPPPSDSLPGTYHVGSVHNHSSSLHTLHLRHLGGLVEGDHYEFLDNVECVTEVPITPDVSQHIPPGSAPPGSWTPTDFIAHA
jgi:hypothetical protein